MADSAHKVMACYTSPANFLFEMNILFFILNSNIDNLYGMSNHACPWDGGCSLGFQ